MKISNRNILRIARLYGLANDNTPLKSLLKVHTRNLESYVSFSFTLNKKSYFGLYGSVVDEDDIDQLWPEKPKDAEILINPLDNSNYTTPFHGKYAHRSFFLRISFGVSFQTSHSYTRSP